MTANQLALASLREATRHNTAGEEENARHNQESERIQTEINNINKIANELLDERERQKMQYQKEYNDAYLNYLKATVDEKQYYDQEMVRLKEQENFNIDFYNRRMANIAEDRKELERQSVENDRKYKEAWKTVQLINAGLENKRIEYEASLKREGYESQERIQKSINALTEWRDTANYILSMQNSGRAWSELRNDQQKLQLQIEQQPYTLDLLKQQSKEAKSKTFSNYWNSITGSLNETAGNVIRAVDLFYPFNDISGGTQDVSKKAFEQLFK